MLFLLVVQETDVLGIHKNELVISKVPMVSHLFLQESRHQTVRKLWSGCADPGWGTGLMHPAGVLALVSSLPPSSGEQQHSGVFSDHASSVCLSCRSLACFLTTLSWTQPRLALDLQSSCLRFQITGVHHRSQLPLLLIFISNNRKQSMSVFPNYQIMLLYLFYLTTENIIFYLTNLRLYLSDDYSAKISFYFKWRGMFLGNGISNSFII